MIRDRIVMPSTRKHTAPRALKKIDLAVFHAMGEYVHDGYKDYFAPYWLEHYGTSAHALITPRGQVIETVPVEYAAWHTAGHNKASIGVEFLVEGVYNWASFVEKLNGNMPWVTQAQVDAGVEWLGDVAMRCPNLRTFKRHSDLSDVKPGPGKWFPMQMITERVLGRVEKYVGGDDE